MKVKSISFENKNYQLVGNDSSTSENLFTILVGRNGSGKSRILQKICLLYLNSIAKNNDQEPSMYHRIDSNPFRVINDTSHLIYGKISYQIDENEFEISIDKIHGLNTFHINPAIIKKTNKTSISNKFIEINKIIAVSTSPFDKFPTLDRIFSINDDSSLEKKYIYRGARIKINSQKDYLKTKFDQLGSSLINFFLRPDKTKNKVSILLNTLEVSGNISIYFTFPWNLNTTEILNSTSVRNLSDSLNSVRFFKDRSVRIQLTDSEEKIILKSLELVTNFYNLQELRNDFFHLDLDLYNLGEIDNFELLNSLSILASYDLIELADIKFIKNNNHFYLTEASSGELSLIFNLLSIAGEIENDSLILIDEPEVSLHPEWQSKFIPLLISMFSDYKDCHFIIATHSPQMLSSINNKSFIINLENDNKLIKGESISKMSSDYQLAYVLKEPGHKNEYLTRIALTVFTNVTKNKSFSSKDYDSLNLLRENFEHINPNDPVHQLIIALEEMSKIYV